MELELLVIIHLTLQEVLVQTVLVKEIIQFLVHSQLKVVEVVVLEDLLRLVMVVQEDQVVEVRVDIMEILEELVILPQQILLKEMQVVLQVQ